MSKKLLCQINNKRKYVEIYQLEQVAQSVNRRTHRHRGLAGCGELHGLNRGCYGIRNVYPSIARHWPCGARAHVDVSGTFLFK